MLNRFLHVCSSFALLLTLTLALTSCGGSSVVGKWTIDAKATLASFEAVMQKTLEAIPAAQRDAAKAMMISQVEKMHAHLELRADNSVVMHAEMPGGDHEESVGTWSLAGDQLTLKTAKKGGKTVEMTGTVKGQTIEVSLDEGGQKMTMVFKRAG